MAGAEEIERGRVGAEALAPGAPGRRLQARLAALDRSLDAPIGRLLRDDGEGTDAFGGHERRQRREIAGVEGLDAPLDPPATALREFGAERDDAPQRRPASRAERRARLGQRRHSIPPPPIVP